MLTLKWKLQRRASTLVSTNNGVTLCTLRFSFSCLSRKSPAHTSASLCFLFTSCSNFLRHFSSCWRRSNKLCDPFISALRSWLLNSWKSCFDIKKKKASQRIQFSIISEAKREKFSRFGFCFSASLLRNARGGKQKFEREFNWASYLACTQSRTHGTEQ